MHLFRRFAAVALLVVFVGLSAGCVAAGAAAAGAGTAAYVTGDTEATLAAEPQHVLTAARETYKAMDIAITDEMKGGGQRRLKGETGAGETVSVSVEPRGESTKVWVRVGFFGDSALSHQILERIKQRL
jgi:hypothetical protein